MFSLARLKALCELILVLLDAIGNAENDHLKHEGMRISDLIKQGRQPAGAAEGQSFHGTARVLTLSLS